MTIYPLSALRAVALRTQGLHAVNATEPQPTRDAIYEIVSQIGCVQIDTINVVWRSHYLVPWSRLGNYDAKDLDALSSPVDFRLFEGWQHAACYISLEEYRYQLPHQRRLRESPAEMTNIWLAQPGSAELLQTVRQHLHTGDAVTTSDFKYDGPKRGTWWDWKPAKYALEYLYSIGEVLVAERLKFQKVYDLTGRLLPEWVDISEPTPEERDRFWVARGARALGVCTARHAGDYSWMKVSRSKPVVESLVKDGTLVPIQGQLANNQTGDLLVHRDNLPLLGQAADGALRARRTTFLSPFDNLFWAARRDEMLWGFHQALEAYLPASKRVYGYFCLPILHNDRLVGRFDPKLERKDGTLRLKALYLEAGVEPDDELVADVAAAMRDFLAFHKARNLIIERSQPDDFGARLLARM